jgi:hypothetical protein
MLKRWFGRRRRSLSGGGGAGLLSDLVLGFAALRRLGRRTSGRADRAEQLPETQFYIWDGYSPLWRYGR